MALRVDILRKEEATWRLAQGWASYALSCLRPGFYGLIHIYSKFEIIDMNLVEYHLIRTLTITKCISCRISHSLNVLKDISEYYDN